LAPRTQPRRRFACDRYWRSIGIRRLLGGYTLAHELEPVRLDGGGLVSCANGRQHLLGPVKRADRRVNAIGALVRPRVALLNQCVGQVPLGPAELPAEDAVPIGVLTPVVKHDLE